MSPQEIAHWTDAIGKESEPHEATPGPQVAVR